MAKIFSGFSFNCLLAAISSRTTYKQIVVGPQPILILSRVTIDGTLVLGSIELAREH